MFSEVAPDDFLFHVLRYHDVKPNTVFSLKFITSETYPKYVLDMAIKKADFFCIHIARRFQTATHNLDHN